MPPQQERDVREEFKNKFNIAYTLALIHQRGIVVLCRDRWGAQTLGGMPTFLALILMVMWAAFTRDAAMWAWVAIWLLCFVKRRIESVRLKGKVHSYYDGRSADGARWVRSERTAKLIVEPILVGILGVMLLKGYEYLGWPVQGLPYYLLTGVFTLPFVEGVKQTVWNRRIQAMQDAKIENEALVDEYQNKFGN